MAKMKVDWKQLFMEKGERIGVGVAGALCVLMIVPMFSFMLFAPSSKAVSEELAKGAEQLKSKQASSTPDAGELPPPPTKGETEGDDPSIKLQRPTVPGSDYPQPQLVLLEPQVDKSKRLKPSVLVPVEGHVDVALLQLVSYMLFDEGTRIMKLRGDPNMGNGPMGPMTQQYLQSLSQKYQMMAGRGRKPGGGGARGYMPYGPNPGAYSPPPMAKADAQWEKIKVEDIAELKGGERLADTVQPVRMAVIVASFPYKRQIQEFRDKLHLQSDNQVVEETVDEEEATSPVNPQKKPGRNTFSFLSPLVERRLVDVHGTPLPNAAWAPVDLVDNYRELLRWNGMRFEKESTEFLDAICFDGLTMYKLAAMGKSQYPDELKMNLKSLNDTVEALRKSSQPAVVRPKNPLDPSGFDPFSRQRIDLPGPGVKPPPVNPNPAEALPEYCMIRLIDVDVHPGQYYQYRIKVRMGNPNLGMKDKVASPDFATSKDPLESEWFEVRAKDAKDPQVVSVPPEYYLYPMDQSEKDNRAVFQIHKWLEETGPPSPVAVGEWSVAERVLAYRGEYIGRKARVEVPYWRSQADSFVLAVEPNIGARKPPGIDVDFGVPPTEDRKVVEYPILVDFEGGPMTFSRVLGKDDNGKEKKLTVNETAGVETLILSPDGKLLSKNSWTSKVDDKRIKRLEDWQKRIQEVKEGKATGGSSDDPFGKTKPPVKP